MNRQGINKEPLEENQQANKWIEAINETKKNKLDNFLRKTINQKSQFKMNENELEDYSIPEISLTSTRAPVSH